MAQDVQNARIFMVEFRKFCVESSTKSSFWVGSSQTKFSTPGEKRAVIDVGV